MQKTQINAGEILLVDDEPGIIDVIAYTLQTAGWTTRQAHSVAAAREELKRSLPTVVLSDVQMPRETGMQLLKEIRNTYGVRLPVILMSGFSNTPLWEVYDEGAEFFSGKPFDPDTLQHNVLQVTLPVAERLKALKANTPVAATATMPPEQFRIGRGGAFVATRSAFPVRGDVVQLQLRDQARGTTLDGEGLVRWVRPQPSGGLPAGYGVEFISVKGQGLELLETLQMEGLRSYIPKA